MELIKIPLSARNYVKTVELKTIMPDLFLLKLMYIWYMHPLPFHSSAWWSRPDTENWTTTTTSPRYLNNTADYMLLIPERHTISLSLYPSHTLPPLRLPPSFTQTCSDSPTDRTNVLLNPACPTSATKSCCSDGCKDRNLKWGEKKQDPAWLYSAAYMWHFERRATHLGI